MSKIFQAQKMRSENFAEPSPQVQKIGRIDLFPAPRETQVEDFNRLAQQALGIRTKGTGTVLFFASSTSGEGASFVSFNLANTLCDVYAQKVLWLDANFLSPQKALAIPGRLTLAEMLKTPSLVDTLVADANPYLVPGGKDLMGSRGLVAGDNFGAVLNNLAGNFDFVIVDIPPVLDSPETGLMSLSGDGLLLVIEQKYLKWEIISHGIQTLRSKGVNVLGSVINRRNYTLPKVIYNRL